MTSTRPLRVYGWQGHRYECPAAANGSHQTREICAARSQVEVARCAGVKSPRQLFNLTETGNALELEIALRQPGVVFWRPIDEIPPVYRASS